MAGMHCIPSAWVPDYGVRNCAQLNSVRYCALSNHRASSFLARRSEKIWTIDCTNTSCACFHAPRWDDLMSVTYVPGNAGNSRGSNYSRSRPHRNPAAGGDLAPTLKMEVLVPPSGMGPMGPADRMTALGLMSTMSHRFAGSTTF
jgi:hypothetical protein